MCGSTSCCMSQWQRQCKWANFDPPQLQNCSTDADESQILELLPIVLFGLMTTKLNKLYYHLQTTHHAKFHFDPTTWVVSANTQFATVRFLSLSFFLFLVSSSREQVAPVDRFWRSTQWTIKKRDILFLIITLANLNRFLQFLYHFNREEILHATVLKFTASP